MPRRQAAMIAAAVLTCLAVVTGVLLARAQTGPSSGGRTVADPSATHATATANSPSVPRTSPTTTPSPRTTSSTSPTPRAPKSPHVSAWPSRTAAAVPPKAVGKRTVTLVNRLDRTIWPAIAADPKHPVEATGWVLKPGASLSFAVPDHWDVRVWARTGCSFDAAGNGHCTTGDCGHFQCGSTWGEFPSTLAEFNLNAWNGMDFYDVSLVEGNNLPMWINSYGGSSKDRIDANGCSAAGCTRDANATCPAKLQRIRGGRVVACLSACLVFKTDKTCCTGAYAARPRCVPSSWPVDSAAVFKKAEPFAYSYVNDDATSVLTCSGECGYRITWGVSP
ncbi:thaumatin family protein [Streptomyces sp. MBT53]|uniref:thaumatin family protein n=1 Tax=Streptomyces sp. MBT53 TaxID=1488384 RepID=UPI001912891D|nr:thaumatin family protein [Streptomyces sp. MBT53]MBK6017937.1 thaumatin family protein [Streptomyces sp. MBT53]